MTVSKFYLSLHARGESILKETISDAGHLSMLTASHNHLADFEKLYLAVEGRPESTLFNYACREYQFSLLAVSGGIYRHAFVSLRLFLELFLTGIQFSAKEIDLRMWLKNSRDISWQSLSDPDTGVFSSDFLGAFDERFSENGRQYRTMANRVYRECSEYVHGNFSTHEDIPVSLEFNETLFTAWHEMAETMQLLVVFAYSARYLKFLQKSERVSIEHIVLDALGTLPAVQEIYSGEGI
jgi:hypothetical protein